MNVKWLLNHLSDPSEAVDESSTSKSTVSFVDRIFRMSKSKSLGTGILSATFSAEDDDEEEEFLILATNDKHQGDDGDDDDDGSVSLLSMGDPSNVKTHDRFGRRRRDIGNEAKITDGRPDEDFHFTPPAEISFQRRDRNTIEETLVEI